MSPDGEKAVGREKRIEQRYRIFFFPGKVYFLTFLGKNRVSEWKVVFFFSGAVFFFPALWERVSECSKLFQGKNKIQIFVGKKKYTTKLQKYLFIKGSCRSAEWVAYKLFMIFFFQKSRKKKYTILLKRVSEWR